MSEELYRKIYNVPDPDNEYAELLYARGYLISDEPYVVKSDWVSMSFGEGLCITYDNRCEVAYVVRDKTWVLILGTVMDTIENHMDAERVAAKIAEKYAAGEDALYDYIDYLGGRHIIVYGHGKQAYLLQDATGMRSACYHRERLLVASHYNIIQNIVHAERCEFVKTYCEMENRPWLLPGNTTPYEDIMILIPNHRLSLTSLQMKRFFPRKPHLHVDVNEAMDYIADCCARQMEVLSQNRKLMFSITKGNDARITLASTKGKTDDHVFYTYFGQNDPSHMSDYNFVREFAKKHHLNHIGVPCEFPYGNAQWEQLQEVCYHNHYHFHLFWSIPNLRDMLPKDRLVVRSNLVEIIRADFYSDLPAGTDWEKLAKRLYPTQIDNPVYRGVMKRFFEECEYDKIYDYRTGDLIYWEYRMGLWMNNAVMIKDDTCFDTYMLFNHRKMLEYGLGIPRYFKKKNSVVHEVVRRLWPELLFDLPNTDDTLMDDYQTDKCSLVELKKGVVTTKNTKTAQSVAAYTQIGRYHMLMGFGNSLIHEGDTCTYVVQAPIKQEGVHVIQLTVMVNGEFAYSGNPGGYSVYIDGEPCYTAGLIDFMNKDNQINIIKYISAETVKIEIKLQAHKNYDASNGSPCLIQVRNISLSRQWNYEKTDKPIVVATNQVFAEKVFGKDGNHMMSVGTNNKSQAANVEQTDRVKVSIIVPVYNVADYLEETLDSLVNQTLKDIEILCYDDCSDDESGQILDRYAAKDKRVKVIHYQENKTAAQARKDGALLAKGQYIMYVDGDDSLAPESCERLAQLMDEKQVDMIHFGTEVNAGPDVPPRRVAALEKLLRPHKGSLQGNLLKFCFVDGKFHFQIWNKIYNASLVKQAMQMFPDGRFSKAQDLFAFYLIAFFAKSYIGMPEEVFYRYGFGRGVTGQSRLSRKSIYRYAEQALIVNGISDFLKKVDRYEEEAASLSAVTNRLLNDSMAQLYNNYVAPEDMGYAFETMCDFWGVPAVIGSFVEKQRYNKSVWSRKLSNCEALHPAPRKTKRIGTFYHNITNGGAQRVVANLAAQWVKLGYEVVLFTDAEATPDDYPIPATIKRVVLPAYDINDTAVCKQRAKVFYESVKELEIDVVVYHAWVSPALLWDMLCVKMAGALCYVHAHNIFSMPLLSNSIVNRFFEMQDVYALADGIMTLSETDTCYWKTVNSRVFTVVNPLTFDLENCQPNQLDGKTILWLGRISAEKNPVQGIEIFSRVHARHPDARMLIVGKGSESLERLMRKAIADKNLTDCVEMCGFHMDVEPFYRQADIFLCTSKYEGFPMTLQEAQSHGLPCVMYDLPYLTMLETGKGSLCVPMYDKDAAAEKICKLLDDRALLKEVGRAARQNVIDICQIDYDKMWMDIFKSAELPRTPVEDTHMRRLVNTLTTHMQMNIEEGRKNVDRLKKNNAKTAQGMIALDQRESYAADMPARGPMKKLRKKIRTAFRILALDGMTGLKTVLREKTNR